MNPKERTHLFVPYEWQETDSFYGQDCFHPSHRIVMLKSNNQPLSKEIIVYDPHGLECILDYFGTDQINGENWLMVGIKISQWQTFIAENQGWDGFGY